MFQWAVYLTYVVATALTPGPNNLTVMSLSGSRGFRAALPFCTGIWAGYCLLMAVCLLLCSFLSEFVTRYRTVMLVIGAGYILWLAYKTFTAPPLSEDPRAAGRFKDGFLLQFLNPKMILYCVMSLQAYILPAASGNVWSGAAPLLVLSLFVVVANLSWALFGSLLHLLFSKYHRFTNTVFALLLVYCAVSLFL